jgi:DNA-binding CsgD family transcriptional regulator
MPKSGEPSNREQEVIKLLMEGKSNKQIASELHITVRTVEFHLRNIYEKYQVASRVELILKLGSSTVVDQAEPAENRDKPSDRHWATTWKAVVSRIRKERSMQGSLSSSVPGAGSPLSFFDAIRVCLAKYADFTGRATRPEFWWFMLFVNLVVGGLMYVNENLSAVFLVAMLLPLLAAGARRLHDIGKSAWWLLFLLVPVGGLVLLAILWAVPPAEPLSSDTQPA